jgi:hypothetical protein
LGWLVAGGLGVPGVVPVGTVARLLAFGILFLRFAFPASLDECGQC